MILPFYVNGDTIVAQRIRVCVCVCFTSSEIVLDSREREIIDEDSLRLWWKQ